MANLLVLGIFLSTSSVFIKCILYFVLVAMFSSATIILASKCAFANLLNSSVTINLLESGILLSASSFFFSRFVCLNQQYYQFIICSIFKNIFQLDHLTYSNQLEQFLLYLHLFYLLMILSWLCYLFSRFLPIDACGSF